MADSQNVFNFVVDTLKISGAPHHVIDNELIMAQCQAEIPRTFFRPARIETINLQMVCEPNLLAKYPGSELVNQGSFRLQWFVDGIRQRGLICRGTCAYDLDPRRTQREITALLEEKPAFFFEQPFLIYHPHLLVNFKVSFETDERFDELYSLGINLTTGEITSNLLAELRKRKITPNPPKKNLEKRKIPYREGFAALLNHLKWLLEKHDRKWVDAAQLRWEEEVKYLEAYYQEEQKASAEDPGFYRRVAESYRKFRPVIRVAIIHTAVVNSPIVIYTVEAFHGQPLGPLLYDPLRGRVKWLRKTQPDPDENVSR
ncbi:uncharacterized protein YqhG [Hydrogenispora ethanolica]|uniref:Uncharacterized protein YqhG n=1 Tax=Hydrogenispora ethanolica TaxID=1082276 RepID=A0A4V2QDL7_HYDET|nr:YqhG family protein [Hydrogenispora ethanolica]TCL64287.1 uncharacterized protein YqhG [Hydrogenispora ethanolica]